MVLLVQKFAKLYTKLDNYHHPHHTHHDHHQPEELSASLEAFQSQVSKFIGQLALDLKPGSENLSLSWIEKCFDLLSFTNKAFAKLVVDIDYPMSRWEGDSIEWYLSCTLCLLELFNSISSSLSHFVQARLSLSHGLNLLENSPSLATKHLKAIQPGCFTFSAKFGEQFCTQDRFFCGKEWVVHEAVKEMKSIGFWVCGILLSGLYSDGKPYMELKKMAGGFDGSSVLPLDSKISEELVEKVPILKEVKEVNDAVGEILGAASDEGKHGVAKELKAKLHVLEKLIDGMKAEVDDLFAKVMSQRTELIDCLRPRK